AIKPKNFFKGSLPHGLRACPRTKVRGFHLITGQSNSGTGPGWLSGNSGLDQHFTGSGKLNTDAAILVPSHYNAHSVTKNVQGGQPE
ncbi:MAG TPA: hypothetical protein VI685_13740, partial [Candidatus Angelobacter sp.]